MWMLGKLGFFVVPSCQLQDSLKKKKKRNFKFHVVVYAFNPSALEAETSRSLEFEARLVYIESSRTIMTISL